MTKLNLISKVTGSRIVVEVLGKIGGETSTELYRELKVIVTDHADLDLELDFKDLDFIDSSGLGSLVAINSTLLKQGRNLMLRSVPDNLMALLKITNLDRVIKISAHET